MTLSAAATDPYTFKVNVSDGEKGLTRRLPVRVLSGNQPPELLDLHYRIPTTVILPTATPRVQGLLLTNGVPLLEIEQETGRPNVLQRRAALDPGVAWETVAGFTNAAQTIFWKDQSASNFDNAFYRVLAQ